MDNFAGRTDPLARVVERVSTLGDLAKRLYTVPELMRLAGITRRQVNYWAETSLVVPMLRDTDAAGSQPASFYSAGEVVKALIVCELLKARFSLQQVRQIAKNLEERGLDLAEAESYLITDGYSVYYAENDSEAIDILKNHRQMLLLVPVHDQVAKLQEAA